MMNCKQKYRSYHFPVIDDDGGNPSGDGDSCNKQQTAEQQLAAIESQAYEKGYAKGREQSLASEKGKAEPFLEIMRQAESALGDHRRIIQKASRRDAVDIAMAMAERIVKNEIRRHPAISKRILSQALAIVAGQDHIKIRIHPHDEEHVRSIIGDESGESQFSGKVEIVGDSNLQKGGCLIETDFGVVDARIDQQLAGISGDLRAVELLQPAKPSDEVDNGEGDTKVFAQLQQAIETATPIKTCGNVTQVVGLVVEANGPVAQLGCICDIHGSENEQPVMAEVLGFREHTVLMMPLEDIRSIGPGSRVVARQQKASVAVGSHLLGRIIDGLGNPIDGLGPLDTNQTFPIYATPINPLLRQRIRKPLDMGVRSINGLLTVGCGQRMGIFAGSGVGKSVLMGMIARRSNADVNVIALIGERGRELNDFIEKDLGQEGLQKSVVVVATSDHLPLVRVRGAFVATAIAEFFRDQGKHVNLMMDSLTRFAMAQREIGLALGEPPTTKGYTPSVFTLLPKLLERAGTSDHSGTITGLYTVLVEGDDMNEPIADAARSILDGHIVLSRDLAYQNHYPAIDVLKSISRVMADIASLQHKHNAGRLKELLATYRKAEDLINIGAYVAGSNPKIDRAIAKIEPINHYLRQGIQESVDFEASLLQLDQIMNN
jgi:flagellum-specific ATP synthase